MIFIMTDKNKKDFHYRFTEEELTMYNSIIVAGVMRTMIRKAIDEGYDPEELHRKVFSPEFIKNGFDTELKFQVHDISKGKFDMDLFKYEDD